MIYERVVQWVAGPFSAAIGVLAVKAADHLGFLGQVGLGKNATAHAIQNTAVFGATALVTYAAHHKWLDNLAKWWSAPPMIRAEARISNTKESQPQIPEPQSSLVPMPAHLQPNADAAWPGGPGDTSAH